jgi:hypothetical protein
MSEPIIIQGAAGDQSTGSSQPPNFRTRLLRRARKLAAILLWLYVIVKLFIFDIDEYIVRNYLPNLQWVLDYKFFLYVGVIGIVAAFFKKWQVMIFIGYVIFYPLLLILWIFPYAIFKSRSWIVAIAIINSIIRFFAHFKINAIMSAVFLLSALGIVIAQQEYVLIAASAGMTSFVIAIYALAVIAVFKADAAFRVYSKVFTAVSNHFVKNLAMGQDLAVIPIDQFTDKQLEKRKTNLEMAVISNRALLFAASKFKTYSSSNLSLVAGVFKCLWLVVICVIAFALINYAIFKIAPDQFKTATQPSTFLLIYYSFKTFIMNSVSDFVPVGRVAEVVSMAENFFGFFTLSIFAGTLFTQKNARQTKEIEEAVKSVERNAQTMESFVRTEFRITTMDDAITELERLKAGMLSVILWLSRSAN